MTSPRVTMTYLTCVRITNPADFILDIANGKATPEANPISTAAQELWAENGLRIIDVRARTFDPL